jgi:hypothetical protein
VETVTLADPARTVQLLRGMWERPDAGRSRYGRSVYKPIALTAEDQPIPPGTSNPLWDIVRWMPASPPWYDGALLEPELTPWSADAGYGRTDLKDVHRGSLAKQYAWSIITPGDVTWIGQLLAGRPVVEIGAGSGYWAWQLQQAGIDVAAYDPHPVGPDNSYCAGGPYTAVLPGGPEAVLTQHPDRVLLMVWPPYEGEHAAEALRLYCGDLFIYAGEGWGGCTADEDFYALLEAEWTEVAEAPQHVTWSGIHCSLRAYRRTPA